MTVKIRKSGTSSPCIVIGLLLLFFSCDDIVNVDTGTADPILNIDAWINDKPETQTISLTFSQDYFDNENLPEPVSGASVIVIDREGRQYIFREDVAAADGSYRWTPQDGETIGSPGSSYTLTVIYGEERFVATSAMGRVPAIDSLTFSRQENMGFQSDEDFFRGEFWSTDPLGKGDTYWIRTYKNGSLLNKSSEINVAYDAGLTSASEFDGVTFITPVRTGINANDLDEDDMPVSSVNPGDSIYVEIHSITEASFNYLQEVITQTDKNGGLSELFTSTPLANVSTNIVNQDGNGSPVVGFFNVASVSGLGKKFK
ncbi:MAG: hypothetical protein C0490_23490 [Marivirga sp.]|nr:hypothetical protein [Marivirga sp.]